MPKLLIISACLVNHGDDRGGVHYAEGEVVDVPKDIATTLSTNDRALYVDKADDHTKVGRYTADAGLLAAAAAARDAAAAQATKKA